MNRIVLSAIVLGTMLVPLLQTTPAQAQATRTWVSGVGDDANPCSRTAPCKTFAGAISKTATGGIMNCLDPGGMGALTITKSIEIDCLNTKAGMLASAGVNSVNVAAAGITVVLRGLSIEGNSTTTGAAGISISQPATVHIEKVTIRSFKASATAAGVRITNASGIATVDISDSYITDNGNSNTTGGILVKPTGTGSAFVTVDRTQIENNTVGIRSEGGGTSGTVRAIVSNSTVAGNTNNGITVVSAGAAVKTMVDTVRVFNNGFGLVANGAGAAMQVGNSAITSNGTGVLVTAPGQVLTYGTNKLNGNITTDGAFNAPPIGQQ